MATEGRKKRTTATKVLKNPANPRSKHAPKTEEQKFALKSEIAIRMKQGQSRSRVFETLQQDKYPITKNTVYAYAKEIHKEWIEAKNKTYDQHIAAQLARLDNMEEQCWKMLHESGKDAMKTIQEFSFKSEEEPEDYGPKSDTTDDDPKPTDDDPKVRTKIRRSKKEDDRKLISEKIEKVKQYGDIEIIKMIERLWIRRNEILGISMQTTINIQQNFNQNNSQTLNQNIKPVSDKFSGLFVIEEDVRKGMPFQEAEEIEE